MKHITDDPYYKLVVDAIVKSGILQKSEQEGREYSGYVCIDPVTRKVVSVHVDQIGTLYTTALTKSTVCEGNKIQYSFHTHPKGYPKFSSTDIRTLVRRVGVVDQGSCVICKRGYSCIIAGI